MKLRTGDRSGFTLIELMIVILVLAVLVSIAVPVYIRMSHSADKAVANSNERMACSMMDQVWIRLSESGADSYRDPEPPPGLTGPKEVDAQYMSYLSTRNNWVELSVLGGRWRIDGVWKNKKQILTNVSAHRYDWDVLSGRLGVLQDWYFWQNGNWRPNAKRDYVFVITWQKAGRARFTQYYKGSIDISGEFLWNDGYGDPSIPP